MAPADAGAPWWEREHLRLLQPNLRETDADLDVDALFRHVDRFDANALLVNTGGVCAFYPSDLEHHPRAAPLADRDDGDLVGAVTERCREEGVRYVARFDFSKVDRSVFEARPEWAYRDPDGDHVDYHGVVHTCVNGGYQRSYAFDVLREALSSYPIDGVFFNMFGYREHDYSGNYHGPCHCANCRERFREFTGGAAELPPRGYDDADHPEYRRFKRETATELLERVRDLADGVDREVAVATYSEHATHAVTSESNTAVDRPLPRWQYSAVDETAAVEDSWGKPSWNIAINAVDIPYRFQGVSTPEVRTRLYGALTRGAGLAFCVNGPFATYPDPSNFDAVEAAYGVAAEHEATFRALDPVADVALVRPDAGDAAPAYRGWLRLLAESHVPFHVRTEASLGREAARPLDGYDVAVVPDARLADADARAALADAHRDGTSLLATGARAAADAPGFLRERFGATRERVREGDAVRGAYVDADAFDALPETDRVAVDGSFAEVAVDGASGDLPFRTPGTFGPPERVGREGLEPTDDPGLVARADTGRGRSVYLPWGPARLYHRHGFDAHAGVLRGALDAARTAPPLVEADAPPTVEVALGRLPDGHLLQFLNRSGFTGVSYHDPAPVHDLTVRVRGADGPAEVLVGDGGASAERAGEGVACSLYYLDDYAAVRLG